MGQMSKRMSKVSKKYLIEKLACKASLCEKEWFLIVLMISKVLIANISLFYFLFT